MGLLSCFLSFVMTVFVVFRTLIWEIRHLVGLFDGCHSLSWRIQLLTIGILIKYTSKICLEQKDRYLVKKKVAFLLLKGKKITKKGTIILPRNMLN